MWKQGGTEWIMTASTEYVLYCEILIKGNKCYHHSYYEQHFEYYIGDLPELWIQTIKEILPTGVSCHTVLNSLGLLLTDHNTFIYRIKLFFHLTGLYIMDFIDEIEKSYELNLDFNLEHVKKFTL